MKRNSGFTLVEIILSITLLAIIAVYLIGAISNGYVMMIRSGNKGKAMYNAQTSADALLTGPSLPSYPDTLTIDFKNPITGVVEESLVTTGKVQIVEELIPNDPNNNNKVSLEIFIPEN